MVFTPLQRFFRVKMSLLLTKKLGISIYCNRVFKRCYILSWMQNQPLFMNAWSTGKWSDCQTETHFRNTAQLVCYCCKRCTFWSLVSLYSYLWRNLVAGASWDGLSLQRDYHLPSISMKNQIFQCWKIAKVWMRHGSSSTRIQMGTF